MSCAVHGIRSPWLLLLDLQGYTTTRAPENADCRFYGNKCRNRDNPPMRISFVHRSTRLFQMLVTFSISVYCFIAASNPCPKSPTSSPQRRTPQPTLIIQLLQSAHHTKLSILIMFQDTRAQRRSMRHSRTTFENRIILGAGLK
jgi:hypothetical protein